MAKPGRKAHPPRTQLGQALRQARRARGALSQAQAAPRMRLPKSTLAAIESGTHNPTTSNLLALADWLGWTVRQVVLASTRPPQDAQAALAAQEEAMRRLPLYELLRVREAAPALSAVLQDVGVQAAPMSALRLVQFYRATGWLELAAGWGRRWAADAGDVELADALTFEAAEAMRAQGELAQAERLLADVARSLRERHNEADPDVVRTELAIAGLAAAGGDARAQREVESAGERLVIGRPLAEQGHTALVVADTLRMAGATARATKAYTEAMELLHVHLGEDHWVTCRCALWLARMQGRDESAAARALQQALGPLGAPVRLRA